MYRNKTTQSLPPIAQGADAYCVDSTHLAQGESISLILMAAGSSSRFAQSSPTTHAIKKQWLRIGEKPLWLLVADTLSAVYPFVQICITASEQDAPYMQKLCSYTIVVGGETRQESLQNALRCITSEWVLVSDVARAGVVAVGRNIIAALVAAALESNEDFSNDYSANAEFMDSKETSADAERYPLFSKEATLCHATATQCLAMTEKNAASKNEDSSENAQRLSDSQAAGFCDDFGGFQGEGEGIYLGDNEQAPAAESAKSAQKPTPIQVDCVAPILAVPDTSIYDGAYIDRSKLARIQTPQLSRVSALRAALESTQEQGTDESSIIKANGGVVRYIQGDRALEKLTLASDLLALEQVLMQEVPSFMRAVYVGNGLDVHSFEAGKVMKLGGVVIESELGFKAHSDGDVALHSVIDAILGAMGAGDIGEWFPDSSSAWEGADSAKLLELVWGFAKSVGYELYNIDLTIIAQTPRLSAYKQPIRARIAEILGAPLSAINVKATTTEHLGFIGRAEGVCVMSSVCLRLVSFTEVAQSYQSYKG